MGFFLGKIMKCLKKDYFDKIDHVNPNLFSLAAGFEKMV